MKIAVTLVLALVLFAAGAAGTYFLMPAIAPEDVIVARRYSDSIRAVLDSADARMRPAAIGADSLAAPVAAALGADSLAAPADPALPLGDTSAADALAAEPEPLPGPDAAALAEAEAEAERARELAGVLVKLDESELRALIAHLDADVLQAVYQQASARGKTKLLQAIPPEKAALFVRALVRPAERAEG